MWPLILAEQEQIVHRSHGEDLSVSAHQIRTINKQSRASSMKAKDCTPSNRSGGVPRCMQHLLVVVHRIHKRVRPGGARQARRISGKDTLREQGVARPLDRVASGLECHTSTSRAVADSEVIVVRARHDVTAKNEAKQYTGTHLSSLLNQASNLSKTQSLSYRSQSLGRRYSWIF